MAIHREGARIMTLIPQWRKWWRRWSTWLLALIGGINLNDVLGWLPSIQQYMDPVHYKYLMISLSVAAFLALQIHQPTVSGDKS
ncbi:hypothetical protein D3C81_1758440 [compost metagenome]